MPVFLRHACREMRNGLAKLVIFASCLIIGIASITVSLSLNYAVKDGISKNAKAILGGDVAIKINGREATTKELDFITKHGLYSFKIETRSMARSLDSQRRQLVELKAIDYNYPLYGKLITTPALPLSQLLEKENGVFGFIAERSLLNRLGISLNDKIKIGSTELKATGIIEFEPDKAQNFINLGPRIIINHQALEATKLITLSSFTERSYLIALNDNTLAQTFTTSFEKEFPNSNFRIRTFAKAAPRIESFFDNIVMYLTLISLASLLIGGIGISGAIKGWLDSKITTIAIIKCLGASSRHIYLVYFTQALIIGIVSIIIGITTGILATLPAIKIIAEYMPAISLSFNLYTTTVLHAACFGLAIVFSFSIIPLVKASAIKPIELFRLGSGTEKIKISKKYLAVAICTMTTVAVSASLTSERPYISAGFFAGSFVAALVFYYVAKTIAKFGFKAIDLLKPNFTIRTAITNLCRNNSSTSQIVLSMGLGLIILITIAQIETNMTFHIKESIPNHAPAFFFIDIQSNQKNLFLETIKSTNKIKSVKIAPMTRGKVTHLNDLETEKVKIDPDTEWAVRGDRALSASDEAPVDAVIVKGQWWQKDYTGEPLVSVVKSTAEGLGLKIGSTITFNILGETIKATVTNLREVNWKTGEMNFAFILNQKALEGFPHNFLSTVTAISYNSSDEDIIEKAVIEAMPNVSAIRMRQVLTSAASLFAAAGKAIKLTSLVSITNGIMVLAGAVVAGHRKRIINAVILKVLGARRKDILKTYLVEYGIIGFIASIFALVLGSLAAFAVMEKIMTLKWFFFPLVSIATAIICTTITITAGFISVFWTLKAKPAQLLRNE